MHCYLGDRRDEHPYHQNSNVWYTIVFGGCVRGVFESVYSTLLFLVICMDIPITKIAMCSSIYIYSVGGLGGLVIGMFIPSTCMAVLRIYFSSCKDASACSVG